MRKGKTAWKVLFVFLTVLWTFQIFQRSLKTAELSHMESLGVLRLVQRLFPDITMHFIRKAAHFAEFFVLGVFAWTAVFFLYKNNIAFPSVYCSAIACIDESLQRTVPGRSGEIGDVLLDISGSFLAIVVLAMIIYSHKSRIHGGTYNDGDQGREEKD